MKTSKHLVLYFLIFLTTFYALFVTVHLGLALKWFGTEWFFKWLPSSWVHFFVGCLSGLAFVFGLKSFSRSQRFLFSPYLAVTAAGLCVTVFCFLPALLPLYPIEQHTSLYLTIALIYAFLEVSWMIIVFPFSLGWLGRKYWLGNASEVEIPHKKPALASSDEPVI
jgi:hypothetical protein